MKITNAVGMRFGRLMILEKVPSSNPGRYRCLCDCGNYSEHLWSNIQSGFVQSCGCLKKEYIRQTKLKPAEDVLVRQVSTYYKRNAKLRGIPWCLEAEDVRRLILAPCYYCGIEGRNRTILGGTKRVVCNNGIDRLDNNIGYLVDNTVPCCKDCNFAKHDLTLQEFTDWIKRINKHGQLF